MHKLRLKAKYPVYLVICLCLGLVCANFAFSAEADDSEYQYSPQMKGYTYNLKELLEKTEQSLKKVEEKIKQQENETKIREHFERGNQLYKEGKLKEAQSEWQAALKISKDPSMRDHIKAAEKKAIEEERARKKEEEEKQKILQAEAKEKERLLNEQAKATYNEAISLYRAKNYEQAKVKFEQTANLIPHYARTDHYLVQTAENIQKEKKLARQKAEEEKQKILEAKIEEKKRLLNEQAKATYNEAVSLYKAKNYEQAKVKFAQTAKLIPHYANTDYYFARTLKIIQQEKEQKQKEEESARKKEAEARQKKLEAEAKAKEQMLNEQAMALYKEGLSLYREKEYIKAQAKLMQAAKLIPHYSRTDYYLARITKDMEKQKEQQEMEQKKAEERIQREKELEQKRKIDSLYKEAVSLYRQNKLNEAKALFLEILSLEPTHQKALNYVNNIIPDSIEK